MIFIARYSFKVERKNEKFSRDVKFYECYKIVKYEKRSSNFSSYNSLIHYFAAFKENSSYSSLRIWDWGKKIAICSSYLVHSCKWWCGLQFCISHGSFSPCCSAEILMHGARIFSITFSSWEWNVSITFSL